MSDPAEELQLESATPAGLLRQMADRIDEAEAWPVGVAVVVCYPEDTEVGYSADDLADLVGGAEFLVDRLIEIVAQEAN